MAIAAVVALLAASADLYAKPGTLVALPMTTLNFYCLGSGRPTVILESGLGGRASQWSAVQSGLAATTTVCAYDRAGYGFSSPGPAPRTSRQIANELAAALIALHLQGPYVLVASSYGTFDVRLVANDLSDEVAGAVFVNPSAEQEELAVADTAIERIDAAGLADAKACLKSAESGELRSAQAAEHCIGSADDSAAGRVRRHLLERPEPWRALVSEWESIKISAQQVADSHQRFGAHPLVVVSAGKEPSYAGMPADQQAALHAFWPKWNRWQDDMAALSSNSYHVRTASADRSTERSDSECVVRSVRSVIAASANGTRLSNPC
jgi:pimeloyl-ACP methyl ester carboxylesterase